jgi:hypothetical protein
MSVKSKSSLFRDLLYLREVIYCKQISKAANSNGIKASNLSKIITDIENTSQKKLFLRASHRLTPTADAVKLALDITEMEAMLKQIIDSYFTPQRLTEIKLYKPSNLQLKFLSDYNSGLKITECAAPDNCDVIISYIPPADTENLIVTKCQLGSKIAQTIWVSAANTPPAIKLAEKIIADMLN